MSTSPPPCPPPPPSPGGSGLSSTTSPEDARASLLASHADLTDVTATLRRSTGVAWESTAADRFRDDVGALLAEVDADLRLLEDALAVLGR